jgi:hypothetical protein
MVEILFMIPGWSRWLHYGYLVPQALQVAGEKDGACLRAVVQSDRASRSEQGIDHCPRSTACAQDQRSMPKWRKPDMIERIQEARAIGVVSHSSLPAKDHGVDRADSLGRFRDLVKVGHNRLLVGNGDIHPSESLPVKLVQLCA